MYDRIALATDGRANRREALSFAVRQAARHEATLHVVCVDGSPPFVPRLAVTGVTDANPAPSDRPGRAFVSTVRETADAEGIQCETALADGRFDRAVARYVREQDIDHVVIARATRQGVLDRLTAGSRGKLVRKIDVPMTFVGDAADEPEPDPDSASNPPVHTPSITIE